MRGDGNGWFRDLEGIRHWGRHGAAGLLLRTPLDDSGRTAVLLQLRAQGRAATRRTWTIPGGARDSHETAVEAALREAWEEAAIDPRRITVRGERITTTALGGWTYTTVVADAPAPLRTRPDHETLALRWVPEADVPTLRLHPDFQAAWPHLRARPVYLTAGESPMPDARSHDPAGAETHRARVPGPPDSLTEIPFAPASSGTTEVDDRVAAALPRTVDLGPQGFIWLYRSGAPTTRTARITSDPIPFYQRPSDQILLRPHQVTDRNPT
ncbi:NUDIX domain-containing protein [Nocardia huaxiensis]|uniref:NUDIX domain-containing protein n=1 Tax=Nocardia huaxiensis TaxID=2755382 RepID=UPI001E532691|nr:NUDIX hydrolase [Nocardia huaxiensis]UFS93634.1 NUDIX hydrolase [Nocardia huaxiensis]